MWNHEIEDQIELRRCLGTEKKILLKSRLKTKASRLSLVLQLAKHVAHPMGNTLPHAEI